MVLELLVMVESMAMALDSINESIHNEINDKMTDIGLKI